MLRIAMALAVIATAIAGRTQAQTVEPFTPAFRAAVPRAAAMTRDGLDKALKDYPSARFREVRAVRELANPAPNIRFCGLLNAKNELGAYTGWVRFSAVQSHLAIAPNGEIEIGVICGAEGNSADTEDYSALMAHR